MLEAGLSNRAASWQRVMPLLAPHVRDVREVIGMVEDLPRSAEAALDLEMDYHTGEPVLDERAGRLRARRREQERAAAEIASDTSELLRRFAAQLSVGDAAVLLGVSAGGSASCEAARADQPHVEPARTDSGWPYFSSCVSPNSVRAVLSLSVVPLRPSLSSVRPDERGWLEVRMARARSR